MAVSSPPQKQSYQIPTHLKIADTFTLDLFGFSLTITMRQGLIALIGGSLVYSLWRHLFWLDQWAGGGPLLHYLLPGLLAFLTVLLATFTFRERHLETWLMLLLRYLVRSRTIAWHAATLVFAEDEQGASRGQHATHRLHQSIHHSPLVEEEEA
ncbi:hypothetical protein [Ktedonobacter robiniae]|uniref:Uncharacterized protein n=1 Tax=Ktedonobacter robiniae TaxID=2778365 RepID=A0ABQ3V367_9CHLR|nr:hypothetical protein [Ktedonobacter robiniae]GHO59207.1 hypothetical protein KSB_76820 [Ktedonobacter robiniae]